MRYTAIFKFKWFPWKYIIQHVARAEGFIDPIRVLSQLEKFAEPSEIDIPLELLRSGAVFQARGLINSRALQHNRDWIMPYWIEQQFNPLSDSFIPRAFSLTVINLTNRNWTAVGVPGYHSTPILDQCGLVMPSFGSWSLDCWVIPDNGEPLYPSRAKTVSQHMKIDGNIAVVTQSSSQNAILESNAEVILTNDGRPVLRMIYAENTGVNGLLVVSLRPLNPEGVSFVHQIDLSNDGPGWIVNNEDEILFSRSPDAYKFSRYHDGDVSRIISLNTETGHSISCEVGMATAAAVYRLNDQSPRHVTVEVPLPDEKHTSQTFLSRKAGETAAERWNAALEGQCHLYCQDSKFSRLYEETLRTLVVLSPDEVFAGPYTYKRFWFRDTAFIVNALICAGLTERAKNIIDFMLSHQKHSGYFKSQDGEWDSNGQVLWVMNRYVKMISNSEISRWMDAVIRGGDWIINKREKHQARSRYPGFMPPGYSAEHLGPSDYFFWDDFWSIAGLQAAADLCRLTGNIINHKKYLNEALQLSEAVDRILANTAKRLGRPAIPAAPGRRLDSGTVGSLAAGYPLQLWDAHDSRLLDSASYLLDECMVLNGLFHDIFHSGINPYLTLHIAQVLLRSGDVRFLDLLQGIADLTSPTGQWPEAVHPKTRGGCMGDGQHSWAAAEWTLMMRNCFVMEEPSDEKIVLCAGIPFKWYSAEGGTSFGPTPTLYGTVSVRVFTENDKIVVDWKGKWSAKEPHIEVRLPGFYPIIPQPGEMVVKFIKGNNPQ